MSLDVLRHQVAVGCRIIAQHGLAHEIAGHISARLPQTDEMLIRSRSAAERGVRFTTDDAIRRTDFLGTTIDDADYELPLELPIHGQAYLARADIGAVLHAHPTYVTLCSVAGVDLGPLYGGYNSGGLRLAVTGVPTYPSSRLIDDAESGHDLATALGDRQVCIMRGHGLVAVGRDVPEAVLNALRLERLAFFAWQLRLAGVEPTHVSAEDIAFFTTPYKKQMGADGPWRWMSYVADEEAEFAGLPRTESN